MGHGLTEKEAVSYHIPRSLLWAPMSLVGGYYADKFNPKYVAGLGLILQAITFLCVTQISTVTQTWLVALNNGVGWSLCMIAQSVMWANYFGRENLGQIMGP